MRSPPSLHSHLSANVLCLLCELIGVLLLILPHSPVHLLPLHALLAFAEGWLALDHLKNQATQPPPVWAKGVVLILDHLRSYKREQISELMNNTWRGTNRCLDVSRESKGLCLTETTGFKIKRWIWDTFNLEVHLSAVSRQTSGWGSVCISISEGFLSLHIFVYVQRLWKDRFFICAHQYWAAWDSYWLILFNNKYGLHR